MQNPLIHPTLRHPLTGEPLMAVGIGKRGPIWPIIGASDDGGGDGGDSSSDGADGDQGSDGADSADGASTDDTLGDAGKKALQQERARAKAADARAKAAEAELEKIRGQNKSAEEKALDKARQEGRAELQSTVNTRLVSAEVRAIAADLKFNDPRDAVVQLQGQLADITVDDDGEVDSTAVRELVKKLANDKKYLIAGSNAGSAADAGIGARGSDQGDAGVTPGLGRLQHAYATSSKSK